MKSRLRKLKQSWTTWEYVKEFMTRVLEILELSDQESIFYFLDGLQGWAKTELERRGVQDLATTIANVDALIEFSLRKDSSKPKDRKVNHEKGGGENNAQPSRDCSKKASLNETSAHEDEGVSDGESMGSMRILIAIKTKTEVLKVVGKNLQYLGATINGVNARALVDSGMIDLSVVLVDDFKVILRLEFLDKMRAFPISFANSLCVLDGGKTCMVNTERDDKSGAKILLTMQFKKGFNRSEPCYLAVTRLDADEGSSKVEVLKVIERVLDEFKDVTPKELPKKLPPRREVDRTIVFLRTTTFLPLYHVSLFMLFMLCTVLYPFTERYAQPYFFSCFDTAEGRYNNPLKSKISPRSIIWGRLRGNHMKDLFPSAQSANIITMARVLRSATSAIRNAQGWVYAVGNAEKNENAPVNPDSNVVTGTFYLNNRYASILFDTGADRSFISIAFSSLVNNDPTPLGSSYDVELADGKIVKIDTIIRGCIINFQNHPFNIYLMPVELGSFDVIIGMDWLRRCHAVIVCDKKLVQIPYGNETLTFRGNESNNGRESRLAVLSCSKS
nr:reverse transcriptase domain-containing protein [Tanacetum cinerariifolium]